MPGPDFLPPAEDDQRPDPFGPQANPTVGGSGDQGDEPRAPIGVGAQPSSELSTGARATMPALPPLDFSQARVAPVGVHGENDWVADPVKYSRTDRRYIVVGATLGVVLCVIAGLIIAQGVT